MEDQVSRLVEKAWNKLQNTPDNQRLLIGISGIPGSGKTTLAHLVTTRLNTKSPTTAISLPMDGYHYTRAHLSSMPDPQTAHARRGAAFTFDAPAFLALIRSLRGPLTPDSKPIYAPSFDHAVKDPKEDDIEILPSHRVVVVEGNYLALDEDVWRDAAALFDELWFVEVDFEVAKRRLVRRHVEAGIAKDEEAAERRAVENDLVNGKQIVEKRLKVDEVVVSRMDEGWVHS
ncbi:Uncharacterized protein SAPIO_CDS10852 [Scedosporium apiospermum]|uniref:Phosphoribulokinase/uridine kinase domain-containing protein n=1 Tax=Pseudallescheria apiosperma TaxID=563466 RepID=A0A084FUQ0_PSEDA|nr:Uncharacterized protein SAPIO_CDS10852 [Scedosporium apiospermum]KEZ38812.1 Uncharacterized protein SAPIO_CDS10852 [Scedosporium apiospermum]